jgi:Family of unknown function (DUF6263)
MQRRISPFLAFLAFLFLVGSTPGQEATLRWKFEKGVPFYETQTTTIQEKRKVFGKELVQKQKLTFYFRWTPTRFSGDRVELKQKLIALDMEMEVGGNKLVYSSGNKAQANDDSLARLLAGLKGAEFTVTLDTTTQRIRSLKGYEEFTAHFAKATPELKPLLEKMFGEAAFKDSVEPMFAALPGNSRKKGDTWERSGSVDQGPLGRYEKKDTFEYDGPVEAGLERILVRSNVKYSPPRGGARGLPFEIKKANLSARPVGSALLYDPLAGRIRLWETGLTLTGTLTVKIGERETEVELDQRQQTTIVTSDRDPTRPGAGVVVVLSVKTDPGVQRKEISAEEVEIGRGLIKVRRSRILERAVSLDLKGLPGGIRARQGPWVAEVKEKVWTEVATQIGGNLRRSEAVDQTVTLDGKAAARHRLVWYDRLRTGKVRIKKDDKNLTIPFTFREGTELRATPVGKP